MVSTRGPTRIVPTNDFPRFALLALVALMLVLSGCATDKIGGRIEVEQASPQSGSTGAVADSARSANDQWNQTSRRERPGRDQNLSEYSQDLGAAAANISTESKQRIQRLVSGFFDELPENSSERRQVFLRSAEAICERDQRGGQDLSISVLDDSGEATEDSIRRLHYAAQIVNEVNGDVPAEPVGDVRSSLNDVTKYAPLIGSYNQLSQSACTAAEERTDDAIRDFQTAMVMFGVDSTLISMGAFYQPAFAGTRFITNRASQVGLHRLRYVCGDRCWALGMSEIHVALRGSMHSVTSTLLRKSQEYNVNLSREDLEAVAASLETDVDQMLADVDDAEIPERLQTVSDEVVSCGESMLEGGNDEENSSEGFFGGDGPDAGDIVDNGQEALEESQQAVERCVNDAE